MNARSRHASLIALPLITSLGLAVPTAQAVILQFNNITYDVVIYYGSYDANPAKFGPSASGGRMPWWGNQALADGLAEQLAGSLSGSPLPSQGPLFATSFTASSSGSEVQTSYFDLTSLGITNTILTGSFSRSSTQSYVVTTAAPDPVPAPLPLLGAATAFTAMGRLRRSSRRLRQLTITGQSTDSQRP